MSTIGSLKAEFIVGGICAAGAAIRRFAKVRKDEFVSTGKKVALVTRDAAIGGGTGFGLTYGIRRWLARGEERAWAQQTERLKQHLKPTEQGVTIEKPVRWTATRNPDEVAGVHPNGQQLIYTRLGPDAYVETAIIPTKHVNPKAAKPVEISTEPLMRDDLPRGARDEFMRGPEP